MFQRTLASCRIYYSSDLCAAASPCYSSSSVSCYLSLQPFQAVKLRKQDKNYSSNNNSYSSASNNNRAYRNNNNNKHQILIVGALNDLITSFERISRVQQKVSEEQNDELEGYKTIQNEAIRHNTMSCMRFQNDILRYTPRANLEWHSLKQELFKTTK